MISATALASPLEKGEEGRERERGGVEGREERGGGEEYSEIGRRVYKKRKKDGSSNDHNRLVMIIDLSD